jgi:phosphoribosylformylglycinamidine cyclo-ligase
VYEKPLLATSTDGVGTKVAIAQAIDKHDTIGQDLVGMVVDDIVVVGAKPLFMTDYIACGKVFPERIADIVRGIASGCELTGTALVGGETARAPGLLGINDYDVAGAATGSSMPVTYSGPTACSRATSCWPWPPAGRTRTATRSSATSSRARASATAPTPPTSAARGGGLLEPTRLYTLPLLDLRPRCPGAIHALSHVTGGGIAANLARVLPPQAWVEVDRSTWSPSPCSACSPTSAGCGWRHRGHLEPRHRFRRRRLGREGGCRASLRGRHRDVAGRRRPGGCAPGGPLRAGRQGRRRRRRASRRRVAVGGPNQPPGAETD